MLFFVLSLFLIAINANTNESFGPLYERLLVLTADENLGTNYVPPTPDQRIANVLDPNHTGMVSSGLYTNAQATALRNDAIFYCIQQFGIDFTTGTVLPNGIIVLPSFTMIPYKSGGDNSIHVASDSAHPLRGLVGDWHGYQYGELIVPTTSGTFPGGIHAGESFVLGDLLTYFDYNLIKLDAVPIIPFTREILTARSPWPGKTVINSQGYADFFAKLEMVDSEGNVAYYSEGIMLIKDVVTGITYSNTRVVATWPKC